jgi:hypothetical protein
MKEKNYRYHCKYYVDGSKREEAWIKRYIPDSNKSGGISMIYIEGEAYELYREDYENPVFIAYLPDGYVYRSIYSKDGKLHRIDGPAVSLSLPSCGENVVQYHIEGCQVQDDDPRLNLLS